MYHPGFPTSGGFRRDAAQETSSIVEERGRNDEMRGIRPLNAGAPNVPGL
jgi:hypothetical protein